MFARIVLACLLIASVMIGGSALAASPVVEIQATCAAELARDPVHLRTLRGELSRALANMRPATRLTLDVSLVRLGTASVDGELEVRAELRALLSDEHGRIRWTTTSRSTARGTAGQHTALQRDAVAAAARELAKGVRIRCCAPR
jgi:hypothetical protein